MATGTATLDFGGGNEASQVVIDQVGLLAASSHVEAFIMRDTTADHTADEHQAEQLHLIVGDLIDDVGFTIRGSTSFGRTQGTFSVRWVWV